MLRKAPSPQFGKKYPELWTGIKPNTYTGVELLATYLKKA